MTDEKRELKRRKFEWIARVLEDKRLNDTHARILAYCCLQFDRGLRFSVTQKTVASNLGVHVNTVANALKRGVKLGWLALAAERQRGHRNQANAFQLTFPTGQVPTPPCGNSAESTHTRSEKVPTRGVESTHIWEVEKPPPTSGDTDRPGYIQEKHPGVWVIKTATAPSPRPALSNAARPPDHCSNHPDGNAIENCPPCGRARKRREQWDREQERAVAEAAAADRALRDNCPRCQGRGVEDLPDGTARKCDHSQAATT